MWINIDYEVQKKLEASLKTHPTLTYSDIILAYWRCSSEQAKYVSMDMVQQKKETFDDPRNYLPRQRLIEELK